MTGENSSPRYHGISFDAIPATPNIIGNASNEENRKGTASVIEVPKFLLTVIPDRKMTLTSPPLIVGDKVAVEWQLQGTLNKKDQSGKKDAKVITFKGASFFEVKNNKIIYIGDYYNNHPLRSQLEP